MRLHPFGALVGAALVVIAAAAARSFELPRYAEAYYHDVFVHVFYDLGLVDRKSRRPSAFGLQIFASFVIGALALIGPRVVTRTPLLRGTGIVAGFPGVVVFAGIVIQALPVAGPIGAVLGAAGVLAVGGIRTSPRKPRSSRSKAAQAKSS